ncbi:MAG: SPOR domain-containing protein [Gammaproteobacteria bacterium]|jgi:DedD protein
MDPNIKNRLVGVIVIFALAVIFLPMILDGSGMRKNKDEVVIPPQPLVTANPEFEPKIVELQSKVDDVPELESRFVDESSDPQADQTGTGAAEEPARTAKATSASGNQTSAEPEPEPATRTGGESWVLQVGSFQDRDKALKQRDKLRKSNIAAVFIERFEYQGKDSYRVRLGPFLNREQTRVAQNKIKAKHDIDGIIMKYER